MIKYGAEREFFDMCCADHKIYWKEIKRIFLENPEQYFCIDFVTASEGTGYLVDVGKLKYDALSVIDFSKYTDIFDSKDYDDVVTAFKKSDRCFFCFFDNEVRLKYGFGRCAFCPHIRYRRHNPCSCMESPMSYCNLRTFITYDKITQARISYFSYLMEDIINLEPEFGEFWERFFSGKEVF